MATIGYLNILEMIRDPSRYVDPKDIIMNLNIVPRRPGIYAWIDRRDNTVVYIGQAVGLGGLQQRIAKQHLCPTYLEKRQDKITGLDRFQIDHPFLIDGKIAIDKSAFRKNVARANKLRAGNASVTFLVEHFVVSFVPLDEFSSSEIDKMEMELITTLKPRYNIKHTF